MKPRFRIHNLILILAALTIIWPAAGCGFTTTVADWYETSTGWFSFSSVDSHLNKRLSISPFSSGIKGLETRSKHWGQEITKSVKTLGGVNLVPFNQLAQSMRTMGKVKGSAEERAILAGQPMGINAILTGQLTDLGMRREKTGIYGFRENTAHLALEGELRLIEVATGTVLGHSSFLAQEKISDVDATAMTMGKKPDPKMVDQLEQEIIKESISWLADNLGNMHWTGFVLAVDGKRAQVTVGKDTGFSEGSMLVVFNRGTKIKTGSGTIVYLPGNPVADLKLTEIGERTSWAELVGWIQGGDDKETKTGTLSQGQLLRSR